MASEPRFGWIFHQFLNDIGRNKTGKEGTNFAFGPVFNEIFVTDRGKLREYDCQAGRHKRHPYSVFKRRDNQAEVESGDRKSGENGPPEWKINAKDTDRDCRERLQCYGRARTRRANKTIAQDSI